MKWRNRWIFTGSEIIYCCVQDRTLSDFWPQSNASCLAQVKQEWTLCLFLSMWMCTLSLSEMRAKRSKKFHWNIYCWDCCLSCHGFFACASIYFVFWVWQQHIAPRRFFFLINKQISPQFINCLFQTERCLNIIGELWCPFTALYAYTAWYLLFGLGVKRMIICFFFPDKLC